MAVEFIGCRAKGRTEKFVNRYYQKVKMASDQVKFFSLIVNGYKTIRSFWTASYDNPLTREDA